MKKVLLILAFSIAQCYALKAQEYTTGVGLRTGAFNGVTVKHFIKDNTALEGILSTRWSGFNITGLYEVHNPLGDVDRLYWYYGGGAHIGFWNGDHASWGDEGKTYTVLGADGILGAEYNFKEVPINLSLDWKPIINLVGYSGVWGDGFALSVRYIF